MQNKEKKVYCGSGRKKSDTWISATINPDAIEPFIEVIEKANGDKTRFVRVNINIGDVDKYGKDVNITIDTWKPDGAKKTAVTNQKQNVNNNAPQVNNNAPIVNDELPW